MMHTYLRASVLIASGCLAACAPQFSETRLAPGAPLPVNEARFAETPELLHDAFRDSCQGPNDDYKPLGRNGARCRILPPPDIAAQLLLRYDGALEVPYIIVERKTRQDDDGVVVSVGYFASVPLKSGAEQRVYLRSNRLERTIDDLFRAFGGEPI